MPNVVFFFNIIKGLPSMSSAADAMKVVSSMQLVLKLLRRKIYK